MCALFSITSEEAATAVSPFSLYPVSITKSPAAALPKAKSSKTVSDLLKIAEGRCTTACLSADDVAHCAVNAERELRSELRRKKLPFSCGTGATYTLGAPSVCNAYNRGYSAGTATVVTLVRQAHRGWCVASVRREPRGRRAGGGPRRSKLTLATTLSPNPLFAQATAISAIEATLPA